MGANPKNLRSPKTHLAGRARRGPGQDDLLVARIEAIKSRISFPDLMTLVLPHIDLPDRQMLISCLLPDHEDKTPSFSFRMDGWRCFGCGLGGDVFDFLQAMRGCSLQKAVIEIEDLIGVGATEDRAKAHLLISQARSVHAPDKPSKIHSRAVREIEVLFLDRTEPFRRTKDWLAREIAMPYIHYFLDHIQDLKGFPPRTERGIREEKRALRRSCMKFVGLIKREVKRSTGKDLVTLTEQS